MIVTVSRFTQQNTPGSWVCVKNSKTVHEKSDLPS